MAVLTYLYTDHPSAPLRPSLGTTDYVTNTGAFQERQGYYGYGKYRTGGVLPTDNRYTGQKLDATTGLYYYGARYYDRTIGMFVSPDTLVPDPTNVWDYNRYLYGNLNPLKYTDPTGHCSANLFSDDVAENQANSNCWRYVNTIVASWDDTDYWNGRYTSKEVFLEHVAPTESLDAAFFQQEFNLYTQSEAYQNWQAQQPTPRLANNSGDPQCAGNRICQGLIHHVDQVAQYCTDNDCIGIGNDIVGVGSALLVVGSPLCGPGALVCAGIGVNAGGASTLFGAGWTAYGYANGHTTIADLAVTLPLAAKAVTTSDPRIGLTVSVLQLV